MRNAFSLVFAILLAGCSGAEDESAPNAMQPTAPSEADLEVAQREAREVFEIVPLPEGVPAAPVSGWCSDTVCAVNQVQFAEADWPAAWLGDYDSQRNVAYCLISSCDGAVQIEDRKSVV